MREIVFRGKRANGGGWIFGDLQQNCDVVKIREQESGIKRVPRSFTVNPETVGQYTGLTDKNGKKVFEHDIVKAYDPLDEIFFIGVVKYFDGSFYICDTDFCSYYRWADYEIEAIGNLHDNPELTGGNEY